MAERSCTSRPSHSDCRVSVRWAFAEPRRGTGCLQSKCLRHGCRNQAYRDVFMASCGVNIGSSTMRASLSTTRQTKVDGVLVDLHTAIVGISVGSVFAEPRRGTGVYGASVCGRDAAIKPTGMYSRRLAEKISVSRRCGRHVQLPDKPK